MPYVSYNHTHGIYPNCSFVFAYGVCIEDAKCRFFQKIPREYQCDFVHSTEDCYKEDAFIQYMELLACKFNNFNGEIYLGFMIIFTEILLLFLFLGVAADSFFGPSLCAISNTLGFSENLAGVTLLAFGNASPDIFTAVAGAAHLGPEIVECQLLGAGIFVTSIVASCILLTRSFYAIPSAFLRDTLFYMVAIIWFRFISLSESLHTHQTIGLVVLYCIYVGVVGLDAWYWKKMNKNIAPEVQTRLEREHGASTINLRTDSRKSYMDVRPMRRVSLMPPRTPNQVSMTVLLPPPEVPRRRASTRKLSMPGLVRSAERLKILNTAGMKNQVEHERNGHAKVIGVAMDGELAYIKPVGLWQDFVNQVIPVDDEDWNDSNGFERFFIIIKSPVVYIFKYVIPVVDQGALNNGWCKLLNTGHCIIAPLFFCFSLGLLSLPSPFKYIVGSVVAVAGTILAVVVFVTSKVEEPPKYHIGFAALGFLTSMAMIYVFATEVVSSLDVTGNILNIRVATLAMTLLAYGNSVGDCVANVALAKAGYPRMAWAGCFGSPLLSALIGAGMSLTMLVELKGENHVYNFHAHHSGLITNCFFFLVLSLASSLVIIPAMNFQCRRSYAMFLIFVYAMFLSFSVMCEIEVIHPLGL